MSGKTPGDDKLFFLCLCLNIKREGEGGGVCDCRYLLQRATNRN